MKASRLAIFERRLPRERAYWLSTLDADVEAAVLPLDFPRPPQYAAAKSTVDVPIDTRGSRAAARLVREDDALALAATIAALELCLVRGTGRRDMVIGTVVPEALAPAAAFNDIVPLRLQCPPSIATASLMDSVRTTIGDAFRHARYPFERLTELIGLPHTANRTPLVSIAAMVSGLQRRERLDRTMTDLIVVGHLREGRLTARIEYDPRLFAPATVGTFATHLARCLDWIATEHEAPADALRLMSEQERHHAIEQFNATETPFPDDMPIHQLIEQQVERTPERLAASSPGRSLNYEDLEREANQLAHLLGSRGVATGSRVAILLRHSADTVVAILAVLKAGAAYVPLDPDHPKLRIEFVLDDAAVSAAITSSDLAPLIGRAITVVALDADREVIAGAATTRPAIPVGGGDPAYVIYTSGSTGRPKGVAIAHRSLINYVWWARSVYVDGEAADFALHSSLAFDLTVTSIFTPLITGGAVHAYHGRDEEPAVVEVLRDDRAAVIKLTPGHLAVLAEQTVTPSRLRTLIVGGENLDAMLARRIHERFDGRVAIYNEYGPTEATVGCMIHRFAPDADRRSAVPIGVPAANTRIYVLDGDLQPVAPNGIGELYIGGAGLALGYLGQPELTAERFIRDPFRAGASMYRTGDLARRLPEGTIEYLGRRDGELKVRGHRIDAGEIRAALVEHPQVRDAVVDLLKGPDGDRMLVAYYVARQPVDTAELRAFLRDRVVEAAVPGAFVFMRRLPLTLNGKVNMKALPGLDEIRRQATRSSEPPRSPTERTLAGIWCQLLKIERAAIHDNFFEMGGHSLVAMQLMSRVREALGVELPLRTLFEHPTIAGLAARIDGTGVDGAALAPITRHPRDRSLPLSFAQQRLWFLDQLEPGSAVYNIAGRLQVEGEVDVQAMRASLNDIAARHEALRTTFDAIDGTPVQVIRERLDLELPLLVLTGSAEERDRQASQLAESEASAPFDLRSGPLIRVQLLQLSPQRHILLVTLHHTIADGWSLGVLARELSVLYTARLAGRPADLDPLPIQYADYAVWQRQWLSGDRLTRDLAFWRNALADVPVISLPSDRPRPPVQTFHGAALPVALAPGVVEGVRRTSLSLEATPYAVLLAAYAALLQRWSGQSDLAIGSPIANRTRRETEGLIGFFANTIVLRVDAAGTPTFRELVGRVTAALLDASAHQDLPFERLVEVLQPERALSHNPLFQVMFGLHPPATGALALPGLRVTALHTETGTAKFDLNLLLDDDGVGVSGVFEYNTELFDETTIARLRSHFETLLSAALRNPEIRIADLPLLPAGERRLVVEEWNATAGPIEGRCMHHFVEETAARIPHHTAVVFPGSPDATLTFDELNRAANRLAHHLRTLGVGPDVPVAICLDRSLEMAVAVLAVLKAGGAYVPLDPSYPRERLAQMFEDTKAPLLLGHAATRDRIPSSASSSIVWLDDDRQVIEGQPDSNPESGVTPENLLYVIYTSGSTGRAKGIALSHRALVNLIRWNLDTLADGTGMLQFASLSFDASFHEMFAAWSSGRFLAMIPEPWRRDPSGLLGYLARWPVETAILPVVVLHQWAEAPAADAGPLAALRHLVTTGEQLVITQPIVELFSRLPRCRLHNHYGPSETHVVTALTLDSDPRQWPSRPTIGRPILNSTVYVLDPRMNPTPIGVTGELYIGGTNLARGYLNRPELTAAKFIPDPFGGPGERLYATGDLARWRADGTVEFLGRRDDQVKIRGFRVELGDVESTLNRHPDVGQSVVVAREGVGGQRLVAYVVATPGAVLTHDALYAFVRGKLPEYMVPSVFVLLDGVALTANGKIDRRALPPPPDERPELSETYVEPQGSGEELMAQLWRELLRLDRIGARDNFFRIGGHSLLATQLVSRIGRTFEIDLPLKAVFEAPTVAGLVDALARIAGDRRLIDEIAWTVRAVDQMAPEDIRAQLAGMPPGSPGMA